MLERNVEVPHPDELFIGSGWRKQRADASVDVICPATEERVATVANPTVEDADLAVAEARKAFDSGPWPKMDLAERAEIVGRFCSELEARLPTLNHAWAVESGATVGFAQVMNDGAAVSVWRRFLQIAAEIELDEIRELDGSSFAVRREPVGVVFGILTYNGTLVQVAMKVVPALLAGNTVVAKHAPESQLTNHLIADAAAAAGFPEGVLTIVSAGTEVSARLTEHPDVDMVAFTGGTSVGSEIMKTCAARVARVVLELGGKSAAIVAEDADLEATLSSLVPGSTTFGGQLCHALSRVVVPRSRHDEFRDALVAAYEELPIGDPLDPAINQGPLAVERARDRSERHVAEAKEQGATVATGGKRPSGFDRGWFYEPTLVADVEPGMSIARNEIFGPVFCLIAYDGGIESAIEIANDTPYGLAGAVFTSDPEVAHLVATSVRSGTYNINSAGPSASVPFGGVKQSGFGRECDREGFLEFTSIKSIVLDETSRRDATWKR